MHFAWRRRRGECALVGALSRWYRRECLRYEARLTAALADQAVHLAARDAVACPTCHAEDEQECLYGRYGSYLGAGPHGEPLPARAYPGRVHTRRIADYLATAGVPRPVDVRLLEHRERGPFRTLRRPPTRAA